MSVQNEPEYFRNSNYAINATDILSVKCPDNTHIDIESVTKPEKKVFHKPT